MKRIIRFFSEYKWESAGVLLLLFSVFINAFPRGFIILGGDILQPINMVNNFHLFYYEWSGRVSIFYGIFYLLDMLGVSDTWQLSWYLGIFLIGSYFSFLAFCALVFPRASHLLRSLVSLFYATNLYTLYVFTATWGYTSYQIVYLFVPLLVGLFIKILETEKKVFVYLFLITAFFLSSSFGNPTFAFSLAIFFCFLTLFLFLFKQIEWKKTKLFLIFILTVGSLLLNAFWMIPLFPQVSSGIEQIYSSEEVNLSERLEKTSNAVMDTVRLLQTSEQGRYYPKNFPYPEIGWAENPIIILTFVPMLLILAGFLLRKGEEESRLYNIFFALFVVFVLLVMRVRFPFEPINSYLFTLPGMNALRSYDKLATFVPFIVSTLVLLVLHSEFCRKYLKVTRIGFFVLIILLALPFYAGGLQTRLSYILSGQKDKDFREANYSALVEVPQSYSELLPLFEADPEMNKISMLPFSEGSSIGRVDLPEWKVNGPHIARALYPKTYVELTEPYIPGWHYAESFEMTQYDPRWIPDVFGLIGVKYVLYHKDAKPTSIERFKEQKEYLERIGSLVKIKDTEFVTLYTVKEESVFPHLYLTAASDLSLELDPRTLSEQTQKLHEKIWKLDFKKRNLKDFVFRVPQAEGKSWSLVLNEKYDLLWEAEKISPRGEKKTLEREKSVIYANAWKLDGVSKGDMIRVSYRSIDLFFLGRILSGIALFVIVCGLAWEIRTKRKYNRV